MQLKDIVKSTVIASPYRNTFMYAVKIIHLSRCCYALCWCNYKTCWNQF